MDLYALRTVRQITLSSRSGPRACRAYVRAREAQQGDQLGPVPRNPPTFPPPGGAVQRRGRGEAALAAFLGEWGGASRRLGLTVPRPRPSYTRRETPRGLLIAP